MGDSARGCRTSGQRWGACGQGLWRRRGGCRKGRCRRGRARGNQVAEAWGGVAQRDGGSIIVLAFDAGGAGADEVAGVSLPSLEAIADSNLPFLSRLCSSATFPACLAFSSASLELVARCSSALGSMVGIELGLVALSVCLLSCTHGCTSARMNAVCSSGVVDLRFRAGDLFGAGDIGTDVKAAMGGDGGGQQRAMSAL